jgi:hypothetical protein
MVEKINLKENNGNYTNNLKLVTENESNANDVNQIQMKAEKRLGDKTKTVKDNVKKGVDEYQIIYKVKDMQDDIELNNLNEEESSDLQGRQTMNLS